MQDLFFDRNGHLSDLGVSQYVDAIRSGTTEDLPHELVTHVEKCKECKKEVLRLHAIMADIKQEESVPGPQPVTPVQKTHRWPFYAYRIAAAVAFFVLVGAVAVYFLTSTDEITIVDEPGLEQPLPYGPEETPPPLMEDEEPADRDTEHLEPADRDPEYRDPADQDPEEPEAEDRRAEEMLRDRYAANFEPLTLYESMTEQSFRSFGLEILAPQTGSEVRDGVTFRWEIRYDDPLIVTIIDNHGDRVHQGTVSANEYYFDDFPAPGLYYWRLETDESLLFVGKFVVPAL